MDFMDIILIVIFVVAIVAVVLYFVNRSAYKKMSEMQTMIEQHKTSATIFVIDKKHVKPDQVNLSKMVQEQIPKWQRMRKMYFVMAKVGAQVITLICDKKIYNALPTKKSVKVDLAGMYIVDIKGLKDAKNQSFVDKARREYLNGSSK